MLIEKSFITEIKEILTAARLKVYNTINSAMIEAYWHIGKRIFEEEQQGKERAEYGTFLLKELSKELNNEFGKGFDERELRRMRQFYQFFPIRDALRPELSWTHYRIILRVDNPKAREYYIAETAAEEKQLDDTASCLIFLPDC